ncbi:MAG: VWA domain-containing protein [Candidatus Nomurabacteria bacterium]|nr:VWA domain-containing protein [Candidatus Nomurabacteria bacterium]
MKKVSIVSLVLIFCLLVLPNITKAEQTKNILITFDASGSMADKFDGVSRIDAAKTAVNSFLGGLDNSIFVGLRPFAYIKKATESEACKVTALTQSFTTNRSIIVSQTALLQAVGTYTPLAYTLTQSKSDFSVGNDNVLILLTDGKETCGGDPIKAAGDLFNSTLKVKVYVIGLGVDNETKTQLESIATRGGGQYYDAKDSSSLASSFQAIQNVERPINRTEIVGAVGGVPTNGGNGFTDAKLIFTGDDYRLQNSLAPGQFAYFKVEPCIYYPSNQKVKISLKILGDRLGVNYNSQNNVFEESNLHSYRIELFDKNSFPVGTPIEIRDVNLLKRDFITEIPTGGSCNDYYLKIGSNDFPISKYDLFTIDIGSPIVEATSPSTDTEKQSSPLNSNSLIYILIGIIVILLIVVGIVLFIFLKNKKTSNSVISNNVNNDNLPSQNPPIKNI